MRLRRLVEADGLLESQTAYYLYKIILAYLMLVLGLVLLVLVPGLLFMLVDAVFLGIVSAQLAFVVHDAGHAQICKAAWKNSAIGLVSSFLLGGSYYWWTDAHNKHHGRPNQLSHDPAVNYSFLAFSDAQATNKRGLNRFIIRNQSLFFFPLMLGYPLSMKGSSLKFLVRQKKISHLIEALFLLLHISLYLYFVFTTLGVWQALLFMVVHQSVYGLCLATAFAPNHIGMEILDDDCKMDFLSQQVITARNVKCSPSMDWLFGGLNYQIEHHLFPRMARNNLKKSKAIVEPYLKRSKLPYCEMSLLQSYKDIVRYLNVISAAVKK